MLRLSLRGVTSFCVKRQKQKTRRDDTSFSSETLSVTIHVSRSVLPHRFREGTNSQLKKVIIFPAFSMLLSMSKHQTLDPFGFDVAARRALHKKISVCSHTHPHTNLARANV